MILLWGLPDEEPMAVVRRELAALGVPVALLDQRRYGEVSGTVEVTADGGIRGSLTVGDGEVDVRRLTGMYMRPYPLPPQQAGAVTPARAAAVDTLVSTLFELAPRSVAVVNRPEAMASNDSKPRQLLAIEAAGFLVPDTLVTNDAEELAEFRRAHGTVVYKSTSGIRSIVNVLDAEADLSARTARLATCPTQFQERICGDDYRVHVVGDRVFATRIVTDAIDYRYAGASGKARSMAAAVLPDEVSARAVSLTRALGLLVSGVDLRCSPEGRWYCFEVNTSPAFSWFEQYTGQPIGAAIARLLSGGGDPLQRRRAHPLTPREASDPVDAMARTVLPGSPRPLGTHYDGSGTNVAVFSASARQVTLCLFDDAGTEEQIPLSEVDGFVWHAYLPGVRPPQRYGFRVDGVWDPAAGLRSNPHKLLLDPCARAVDGLLDWGSDSSGAQRLFDYRWADGSLEDSDSAAAVPKSVVVDAAFAWGDPEVRPSRSLADTVVYETHVRGFTMQHPDVPQGQRGTYAGLVHPAVLGYLRELGVTAVELMPVQQFFSGGDTVNYWGYDPVAFSAPHGPYSSSGTAGEQVTEFKTMVRTLHENDLEVILDVVFNHTFEGGNDPATPWRVGTAVGLRGIDNRSYYLLDDADPLRYRNDTGAGNTINVWDPAALQLIMDSLRYWASEMHVDGFRFDLAAVLAQTDATHSVSVFLDEVGQDPVVGGLKLIAEPWAGDPREYLLGRFPPLWSQWNGDFHWDVRDFWKSTGSAQRMADGLLGSPQLFSAADGERPTGSVNYAASHDGSTVRDTVSYTETHPNGGQHSWDCRTSGQADDDPQVLALRWRMQRNLLATTILSQGIPMLLYGDECGRTQGGNDNAYDVDGPTTWMPWGADQDADLLAFTREVLALRRRHPVLRSPRSFQDGAGGAAFLRPDGQPMAEQDFDATGPCALALLLDGDADLGVDDTGRPVRDESTILLLLNASWDPVSFTLPPAEPDQPWEIAVTTEAAGPTGAAGAGPLVRPGRSLMVLTRPVGKP